MQIKYLKLNFLLRMKSTNTYKYLFIYVLTIFNKRKKEKKMEITNFLFFPLFFLHDDFLLIISCTSSLLEWFLCSIVRHFFRFIYIQKERKKNAFLTENITRIYQTRCLLYQNTILRVIVFLIIQVYNRLNDEHCFLLFFMCSMEANIR